MDRRNVLKWIGVMPMMYALPIVAAEHAPKTPLWRTLEAVQNHLLPGDAYGPSAVDMGATHYLYMTMAHGSFDHEVREFILTGAAWPEAEAKRLYNRSFVALNAEGKEAVIRHIYETYDRGEGWLSTLISYTLEAFLGDPIYGGNVQQKGWKWLEHVSGEPRPVKRFVHGV